MEQQHPQQRTLALAPPLLLPRTLDVDAFSAARAAELEELYAVALPPTGRPLTLPGAPPVFLTWLWPQEPSAKALGVIAAPAEAPRKRGGWIELKAQLLCFVSCAGTHRTGRRIETIHRRLWREHISCHSDGISPLALMAVEGGREYQHLF